MMPILIVVGMFGIGIDRKVILLKIFKAHKYIKLLSLLALLVCVQSCAFASRPVYDLPYSYDEKAPDMWKLGWQQGCKSGFSVYGTNFHRALYKYTQDVEKMKDGTYYKAWLDSFNYCRHYMNRYLAGESLSHQTVPGVFSSKSLNITSSGLRDNRPLTTTGLFSSEKTNKGLFSDMFEFNLLGHGSTAWGASVDECDWLNRCGSDKPADWHF